MSIFGKNSDSNSQPENNNMNGLLPVFGCDSSTRKGDIIFVHGLAGHSWSTWHPQNKKDSKDLNFWLYWLGEELQQEEINVCIWTFGYEAARFKFSGAAMPLFDQASNLLEYLKVKNIGERPLIFVTHSMGGLLVKEAIRSAQNFDDYKTIIKQTKGIVFLATPHTGSHLASLIKNLGALAAPSVNVQELETHKPELRNLNEWYRQNIENLTIETKIFYETQPMNGILVVDEDSANPGIKNVKPIAISKDHNSIAKPQKSDLVYLGVKDFVIKELSTSATPATIAALVITKALNKEGKEIGENVVEEGNRLLSLLKSKKPDTVESVEKVVQQQESAEQQSQNYRELIKQLEDAASGDSEIAAAIQAITDAVKSQSSTINNYTKLAEKIGIVVQGGEVNIENFNFE